MGQRYEGFVEGYQGLEIFYQGWRAENPKGTLLVTHGLGEHSEIYDDFGKDLNSQGWGVIAYDLRGHGRSEGQRGYVADFKNLERDLAIVIDFVSANVHVNGGPFVLFGHSLGGLISMKTLLSYEFSAIRALCLSSPATGVALVVPKWKHQAALVAAKWLPRLTLFNEVYARDLIADPTTQAQYDRDPLRHDKISPGFYLGTLQAMQDVHAQADKFVLPVSLQLPRKDRVVSSESSIEWFDKIKSTRKTLHIYEQSLHEVFNDIERELAIKELVEFLNAL